MLPDFTINIRGSLVDFKIPKIMGVINTTPDSFYEGSRATQSEDIVARATKMVEDGADFLDIGGYSSRPGADDIPFEKEIERVVEPIKAIKAKFPQAVISIDTFRSKVAREAVYAGADIINDISAGLLDSEMLDTVADLNVPYIAMHMKGTPQNMKKLASYDDLLHEMIQYFSDLIARCKQVGIKDVLIDPGFGFAKTIEHNFELLSKLELLWILQKPMLIGVSRKSMIYKTLQITPNEALNGTTSLNTVSLIKGASVLRVHDVKEAKQIIKLYNKINKIDTGN